MKVLIKILIFSVIICIFFEEYVSANSRIHPNWPHAMDKICGPNRQPLSRIINGVDATLGQFPWMARIHVRENNKSAAYICGGSLITDRHVLTAAHCVTSDEIDLAVDGVLLGDWDVSKDIDCQNEICAPSPQYRKTKRVMFPESYSSERFTDDIAIITLHEPIVFNEYVVPICLPDEDLLLNDSDRATVAGWGLLQSPEYPLSTEEEVIKFTEENSPNILQWLGLLVLPMKDCQASFGKHIVLDTSSQICAGNRSQADSCSGDSGGPLMSELKNEERGILTYLTGIVSFGVRKCGDHPAIYTRVAAYMKFVLDNLIE